MANRSLALQLDEVVQAMLVSLQPRREKTPDRELASLARANRPTMEKTACWSDFFGCGRASGAASLFQMLRK